MGNPQSGGRFLPKCLSVRIRESTGGPVDVHYAPRGTRPGSRQRSHDLNRSAAGRRHPAGTHLRHHPPAIAEQRATTTVTLVARNSTSKIPPPAPSCKSDQPATRSRIDRASHARVPTTPRPLKPAPASLPGWLARPTPLGWDGGRARPQVGRRSSGRLPIRQRERHPDRLAERDRDARSCLGRPSRPHSNRGAHPRLTRVRHLTNASLTSTAWWLTLTGGRTSGKTTPTDTSSNAQPGNSQGRPNEKPRVKPIASNGDLPSPKKACVPDDGR